MFWNYLSSRICWLWKQKQQHLMPSVVAGHSERRQRNFKISRSTLQNRTKEHLPSWDIRGNTTILRRGFCWILCFAVQTSKVGIRLNKRWLQYVVQIAVKKVCNSFLIDCLIDRSPRDVRHRLIHWLAVYFENFHFQAWTRRNGEPRTTAKEILFPAYRCLISSLFKYLC